MAFGRKNVVWAAAQADSGSVELEVGLRPVGLFFPATFTGASITFKIWDGTAFVPVYGMESATPYGLTVGTSRYIPIDPRIFIGADLIVITSASSESIGRTVGLAVRPIN